MKYPIKGLFIGIGALGLVLISIILLAWVLKWSMYYGMQLLPWPPI